MTLKTYRNCVLGSVDPSVKIGFNTFIGSEVTIKEDCEIGHNTVIDGKVVIGSGNYIGHNTVIQGSVHIGSNNHISVFVEIGTIPQHYAERYELNKEKYDPTGKSIYIGDNNVFTAYSGMGLPLTSKTEVKNNCYIMSRSGIAHDSVLHDRVVLGAYSIMGGYTRILSNTVIGLSTTIHQQTTIGSFTMIGMGSLVTKDIPPGILAVGHPVQAIRFNKVGFQRNKIVSKDIDAFEQFYRISQQKGLLESSLEEIDNDFVSENVKQFFSYRSESRPLASIKDLTI